MKPSDIEAWVLRIVDQVKNKQPCEDSRVELKAEWPADISKAARQIAAHANAARGESILWIIGIDESRGIVGADNTELADWLPAVKACFNGLCPEVIDVNVPVDDKTVVALLFSTDRVPFVVKNSAHGKKEAGPVELEVPWREGRSTRSARREDLLRILFPISQQPSVDILGGDVTVSSLSPADLYKWDIYLYLYVAPSGKERIVIPFHKCQIAITVGSEHITVNKDIRVSPPTSFTWKIHEYKMATNVESITIASTKFEVIIDGPGRINIDADFQTPKTTAIMVPQVTIALKMHAVHAEKPLVIEATFDKVEKEGADKFIAKWKYNLVGE